MVTRSANATRVIEALQGRFGARLSTNRDILERHGLNEGQKVSFEVRADRKTGKSSADNLKAA